MEAQTTFHKRQLSNDHSHIQEVKIPGVKFCSFFALFLPVWGMRNLANRKRGPQFGQMSGQRRGRTPHTQSVKALTPIPGCFLS
eukprot:2750166-Amphidinium_carterae.2